MVQLAKCMLYKYVVLSLDLLYPSKSPGWYTSIIYAREAQTRITGVCWIASLAKSVISMFSESP